MFIPYFTREWNCLETSIRNEMDIGIFKCKLKDKLKPPKYRHYKYGNKYIKTLICQLRAGRTYLKADKFANGLYDTDRCECGQKETILHFFSCSIYRSQQNILFGKINEIMNFPGCTYTTKCFARTPFLIHVKYTTEIHHARAARISFGYTP